MILIVSTNQRTHGKNEIRQSGTDYGVITQFFLYHKKRRGKVDFRDGNSYKPTGV